MTVHRRFLLAPSFARLIQRERGGLRHVEGFFPEQQDRSAWVRLDEDRGVLILRTVGRHGVVEEQTEIPVAHAHALLDVCAAEIDYIRTAVPIDEGHAMVDEIIRPCVLHRVTVAFETDEQARGFHSPMWFGPEVTEDRRYTNQFLALRGLDHPAPEISLSDRLLNSLIDTLEGSFPVQSRIAINRPRTERVPEIRAEAQTGDETTEVSLEEIEDAMMREMEKTNR